MTPQERIQAHIVGPMDDDVCWETDYYCKPDGYPNMYLHGTNRLVHRVVWEIYNCRPVPPGMVVRHTCDNHRCCNPNHLLIGTQKRNMEDSVNRNRHKRESKGYFVTPNGKYYVRVRSEGRQLCIGVYDTPEEAHAVYLAKREELHGVPIPP